MNSSLRNAAKSKSKERINEVEMSQFLERTQDLLPALTLDRSLNMSSSKLSPREVRIDLNASTDTYAASNENLELDELKDEIGMNLNLNHPKYPQFFKKRYCYRFVNDPKTNLCCGCQKKVNEGSHIYTANEWNYRTCTRLMPTDAFGKLTFPGSHSKTANYIRVQNETKTRDMIQFLYSPEGWNLQKPQLILSVTGGAQKFTIPHRMKKAFKRGLIKAAASTGAWIITGGTNTGVMRLVGEAVADEFHVCNLTVLGIATWGKIAFRDQMQRKIPRNLSAAQNLEEIKREAQQVRENGNIYKKIIFNDKKKRMKKLLMKRLQSETQITSQAPLFYAQQEIDDMEKTDFDSNAMPVKKPIPKNTDVLLDPNHTHFILVDDGSEGLFGKEIEFRAHLEAELRKGKSLKYYEQKRGSRKKISSRSSNSVSLALIQQSDEEEDDHDEDNPRNEMVPMILIVVQGGPNTLLTVEESLKQNVPVLVLADSKGCADLIANACLLGKPEKSMLEKLLVESKMFERIKDPNAYAKETSEAIRRLEYIVSKIADNLINVFRLDSEGCGQDIELTILRAFLNSRKNEYYENLKLALQWNRNDIAKTDIFTGEEEFKSYQLMNLMEMALIQNKPEFVELLLENGLNLKSFLTVRRLCFLYNSQKIQNEAKKAPIFQLYKKKYSIGPSSIINFKGILKFLKEYLFEDFEPNFLPEDLDPNQTERFLYYANKKESSDVDTRDETLEANFGKIEVPHPEQNLFLWALLLNRIDIAHLFWQIGEHHICSALFASNLLKSISTRLSDLEKEIMKHADDFEEMAVGVLNIFDNSTDDLINGVILLRKIPFYNLDCLQMAVEANCQKFVALSSVQNLLTDIWYGKIVSVSGAKATIKFVISCFTFGMLAPFLLFEHREKLTRLSDRENTLKKLTTYNKKKNITNLLRSYLANYEINMDKKEANLLPNFCRSEESCSSSSSSDASSDDESSDNEEYSRQRLSSRDLNTASREDVMRSKANTAHRSKKVKESKWATYWNRYKRFLQSPRVHFVYDATFYLIFLLFFSYIILCEFSFYEVIEETTEIAPVTDSIDMNDDSYATTTIPPLTTSIVTPENFSYLLLQNGSERSPITTPSMSSLMSSFKPKQNTSYNVRKFVVHRKSGGGSRSSSSKSTPTNASSSSGVQRFTTVSREIRLPSWIEYLLIYWMFAFMAEEARQYFFGDAETKILKNKLLHYFANNWNYLDISGGLMFTIGMSLRFVSIMTKNENLFVTARIILCIDLVAWYMRLLHVSVVFRSLGPKLVMIQKMVRDLMFFISIIAIFVCAFGVTTQATMFPGNEMSLDLIKKLLNNAYWPIYGDMKILDKLEETCDQSDVSNCPLRSGVAFSYVLLMVYMVVANILLINLLIAMFSSTFQDVQENTDQIWKFQRYRLVFEYYDSPILPPPLNFIAYIVSCVNYFKRKKSLLQKSVDLNNDPTLDIESETKDEVDLLLDRERKYAEEFLRMKKLRLQETTEAKLRMNTEKLETIEQKLNEVIESRFKESNQLNLAVNWIMNQLDTGEKKNAPYIENFKANRRVK